MGGHAPVGVRIRLTRGGAPQSGEVVTGGRAVVSFSGGKDSMLALHRAAEEGLEIAGLLCMLDESGARSRSHGIRRTLLEAQARALELPLATARAGWTDYEEQFRAALRAQRTTAGITDVVFGDIDLDAHRIWEEEQCAAAGVHARLPLWKLSREVAVREFIDLGYRARVVCVNARWLDERFAGREFDAAFIADLPPGVDRCGENGEFHTFVFAGPRFRAPVEHRVARVVRHDARHAFGDATYFLADLEG
jgi:uncharacterized protein (TIGR00290 family)